MYLELDRVRIVVLAELHFVEELHLGNVSVEMTVAGDSGHAQLSEGVDTLQD